METTTSYPLRTSPDNTPPPTLTLEEALTRIQEVFRVKIQEGMTLEEQQEACFSAAFRASKEGEWQKIDQVKEALTILTDKLGRSILQRAIDECETEIAHHLIDNQIALHPKNHDGDTVLHRAARQGDIELIAKLYKHNYINAQNHKGQTPLHVAILSGQYEVVAALLLNGANLNSSFQWGTLEVSPLALATLRGEIKCLKQLLKHKKANVKEVTHSIGNLLHVAVHFNQLSVIEYLFRHHVDRVKPLLEEKDAQGRSPLCLATVLDDPATVIFLHARGGDIESEDNQGRRPLHYAATALNQNLVELLYYLGANLSAADHTKDQNRPLDLVKKLDKSTEKSSTKKLFANLMERVKGEEHAPPQFAQRPPINIVFKGGGPKGIAYVGAIRELEKEGLLNEVERYAGASAGAITATLLAMGYSSKDLKKELAETNLEDFMDVVGPFEERLLETAKSKDFAAMGKLGKALEISKILVEGFWKEKSTLVRPLAKIKKYYNELSQITGLCEGEVFRLWMEEHIYEKTRTKYFTFGDLRRSVEGGGTPFKHLHVFATRLGESQEITHISSEDSQWDKIVISSAVATSMSIPGAFKPRHLHVRKNGQSVPAPSLGIFADGGMLGNLPVEAFDKKGYQMRGLSDDEKRCPFYNKRTLGFSLYSPEATLPKVLQSIDTVKGLLKQLITVYFHAEDIIRQQDPYNKHRVIEIDNMGVDLLNFNLSEIEQKGLIKSGKSVTRQFLKKQGNVQKSLFHYPRLKKEAEGVISLKFPHPHFVGRKELLGRLEETLIPREWKRSHATMVQALYGPGGIGKSETALKFADNHLDEYSLVWWIDAESKESQNRSYRELAQALRLDIEKDSPEAICGKVHTCLEQRKFEQPWLLIYDNVENPIEIPQRGGVALVTTRNKQLFPQLQRIEVKPFDYEDAIELFEKITNKEKSEEMENLVKNLGDYPLVLTQVASYIAETPGMNLKKYLEKRQEGSSSSRLQPDDRYKKTLSETLETTLELLQAKDPQAVRWLEICTYLSPDGVELSYLDHWLEEVCKEGDVVKRDRHSEEIRRLLTNYSLLRFDKETDSLSIHRSIQEALRDRRDKAYQEEVFQEAFSFVLEKGNELDFDEKPNLQETMKHVKQCEPHALALLDSSFFNSLKPLNQALLLSKIGKMGTRLRPSWNEQKIFKFCLQAFEIRRETLDEKHPEFADALIDMGNCLENLFHVKEALGYYYKALEIQRKKLDNKHLKIASTLAYVGNIFGIFLDRKEKALENYREALEIQKEKLGERHPKVAATLCSMGYYLGGLGRNEEALEHYREALEIRKEKFGKRNSNAVNTLLDMGGLLLKKLGRKEEALERYHEAIEIEKFRGDYQDFVNILLQVSSKIAGTYNNKALGYYRKALETYNNKLGEKIRSIEGIITWLSVTLGCKDEAVQCEILKILKETLGEKHPLVAKILFRIAVDLGNSGCHKEASDYYHKALDIRKETLGAKHPKVAKILIGLAVNLSNTDCHKGALDYFREALEILKKNLGERHTDVAHILNNMGITLGRIGRKEEALRHYREALEIRKEMLGENHSKVADTLCNMGITLGRIGRNEEALEHYRKALEIYKEKLGENHPKVADTLSNMSACLFNSDCKEEALEHYREALEIRKEKLGEKHPDVATTLSGISNCLIELGRKEEALKHCYEALEIRKEKLGENHQDTQRVKRNIEILRSKTCSVM